MSIFNAFIYNTNTSLSNITLHYSYNILYLALGRVLFYNTFDKPPFDLMSNVQKEEC